MNGKSAKEYGMTTEISAEIDIKIVYELSQNQKQDLWILYQNEWWTNKRTLEDIEIILEKTSLIIGLVESSSDRLIGFTRVLTDYFKYAYIYDVIVHPEYRGLNLGKKLLTVALEHPEIKDLASIELSCKKHLMPFYKQFGFTENYGESIAMRRRKDSL